MQNLKRVLLSSILFSSLFLLTQSSFGQVSFSHSIGGSYYISSLAFSPGIMYSPRVNLVELGDELTVSLGTHLGFGFNYNSRGGSGSLALDVPLVAEINFGHGANPDTDSSFGGFAGVGYGISKIGSAGAFGDDYNDALGLVFNGGIRGFLRDRPVGLRVSYMLNTKEGFANVISLGAFYTFGNY